MSLYVFQSDVMCVKCAHDYMTETWPTKIELGHPNICPICNKCELMAERDAVLLYDELYRLGKTQPGDGTFYSQLDKTSDMPCCTNCRACHSNIDGIEADSDEWPQFHHDSGYESPEEGEYCGTCMTEIHEPWGDAKVGRLQSNIRVDIYNAIREAQHMGHDTTPKTVVTDIIESIISAADEDIFFEAIRASGIKPTADIQPASVLHDQAIEAMTELARAQGYPSIRAWKCDGGLDRLTEYL